MGNLMPLAKAVRDFEEGMTRMDELEGISCGHYERIPIKVAVEEEDSSVVEAEAYYGHRSYAEESWRRKREVLIS